jgi:hypothetical protein
MHQIAGVFAQLQKARLVAKLNAARDRKRATGVKVEDRTGYAGLDAAEHGARGSPWPASCGANHPRRDADHCGKSRPSWPG